ncbi:protein ALP1-like [Xenia sp. Carnegie-2017]|uniref:protein ALP1-like n=1 Tax=Xenia sp. Carnegie-2017 TaxID=2897299 RepID=UPI001F03D29C|nr:protein ALP1-like [Xenia sp. Carnegie-2017]
MFDGVTPDDEWKRNFRMSKERFFQLCEELRPYISEGINTPNYRSLSREKKLAITLYYLKDTGSIWMTANAFGVHQCTVSKIVLAVCNAICIHLCPIYLHLPQTVVQMRKKVAEFETRFGITQAFGCIDGTHIPIQRPLVDSQDYFNYKQFFSINVQAVCDSNGLFMDVDCRWPGSVHDAKVFSNSFINNELKLGRLPQTFTHVLPGHDKIPNYLIGDPAYPLTPNCIKEYQSCLSND